MGSRYKLRVLAIAGKLAVSVRIADQVVKILAIKSAINVNKMALIGIIAMSAIATSVKLAGKCKYPIKGSALPQAQYPTRRLTIARR